MTDDHHSGRQRLGDDAVLARSGRDWLSIAGLLTVAATTLLLGTLGELVLVMPLLLAALVVSPTLGFAAGQLALIPTVTIEQPLALGVTQLALLVVLTEPARMRGERSVVVGTILATLGLSAVVGVGLRWGLVEASLILICVVAGGVYLFHRVSRVQLGLVTQADSDHPTNTPADPANARPDTETASKNPTTEPDHAT